MTVDIRIPFRHPDTPTRWAMETDRRADTNDGVGTRGQTGIQVHCTVSARQSWERGKKDFDLLLVSITAQVAATV